MTTITDSSLQGAAREIVDNFMDSKVSLNDGVTKKASELSLNTDQTQRLIERTNTEAFLRSFPNNIEFEVASPEAVLGIKTASTYKHSKVEDTVDSGLFKAASRNSTVEALPRVSFGIETGASKEYQEKLDSTSGLDIFGIDEDFLKEASRTALPDAIDVESREMRKAIASMTKTASEINKENVEREIAFAEHLDKLADYVKTASLSGEKTVKETELELLSNYPNHEGLIRGIYDEVVEKLASIGIPPFKLDRAYLPVEKIGKSEISSIFEPIAKLVENQ